MGAIRWTDHDGCGPLADALGPTGPPALVIRYIDYCLRKRRWWDYSWRRYGAASLRRRPGERDRAQRLEHVASGDSCFPPSITTNPAAITALFRVMNRYVGNLSR